MEFHLTDGRHTCRERDILQMLQAADSEFVPPLSARSSTTQTDFMAEGGNSGISAYWDALQEQKFLLAEEDGALLGFVSYRENHRLAVIGEQFPNLYISTVLVKPEARGQNLTRWMYEYLFSVYRHAAVFTRTWSANTAHIRILTGFGFEPIQVLKNDRGPGIDTVYFKKNP